MEVETLERVSAVSPVNTGEIMRGGVGKRRPRNVDEPKEGFSVEFRFKFLIDRRLNIEKNEGASNVEEKTSHGEVLSGTDPGRKTASRFSVNCGRNRTTVRELAPSPKPEYRLFGILDRAVKFPIFQEPFRIKSLRLGINRLVARQSPAPILLSD